MKTATNHKAEYLARVAEGLADLPVEEREEVLADLEAHLAELDDGALTTRLGTPEDFVAEFRSSAGLIGSRRGGIFEKLDSARKRMDQWAGRVSSVTHWTTVRPIWIWTRGWFAVSLFAVFTQEIPFLRFPVPAFDQRSTLGLAWVVVATAASILIDRREGLSWQLVSLVANVLIGLALTYSLMAGESLTKGAINVEESAPPGLTSFENGRIANIYAFDLEGNPVDVFLYDQYGNPLVSLSPWDYGYEDQGAGTVVPTEFGNVEFPYDSLGRLVPNLYPLDIAYYAEFAPPPGVVAPDIPELVEESP
jgi:hypothetical protein